MTPKHLSRKKATSTYQVQQQEQSSILTITRLKFLLTMNAITGKLCWLHIQAIIIPALLFLVLMSPNLKAQTSEAR
jgi:hypothetical protein